MNTSEILFSVAQILFFLSSIPMIMESRRENYKLKGIPFSGAIITFFGMNIMVIGYSYSGMYVAVVLTMPMVIYWGIVSLILSKQDIERPELSHNDDDRIIKEILPIIISGKQISSIYYIQATAGLLRLTSNSKKQYILTGWFMKGELVAKRIKEYTGIEVLVEH